MFVKNIKTLLTFVIHKLLHIVILYLQARKLFDEQKLE